jgi:hypothetical protein
MWRSFSITSAGTSSRSSHCGRHGGDLHGDAAHELVVLGALVLDHDADLRRAGRLRAVEVDRRRRLEEATCGQFELLADLGGQARTASSTVRRRGQLAALAASRSVAPAANGGDDLVGEGDELGVLGDEVGLGTQLDQRRAVAAATRPLLASRSARLATLAAPVIRRISVAASKSPSASVRAFLASIIPAPVASRSFFTSAAVIAMTS